MSTATAPYPYFNGITYNPSFFSSSSSSSSSTGITQAEADLLYLRKTTADTATATETFSKIYLTEADTPTPSVDFNLLKSETGNIILGGGQLTGALYIGSNPTTATRTTGGINIGTTSVGATPIVIGTSSVGSTTTLNGSSINITTKLTSPVYDSSAATSSMTIGANLTGANLSIGGIQTGDIALGGSQTTGILNIGTSNARTIGARGGGINIGTAAIGAIPIVIGTTGQSTTVLNGTSVKATTKLITPILDCVTDAAAGNTSLSIGPSAVNGNIVIGSALGVGDITIGGAQLAGGTITLGSANTATTNTGTFTSTGLLTASSGISTAGAITLPTTTYTPTSTQLGYNNSAGVTTPVTGIGAAGSTLITITNLAIGIYLVTFSATLNTFSLTTGMYIQTTYPVTGGCTTLFDNTQYQGSVNVTGISTSSVLICTTGTNTCSFRIATSSGTVAANNSKYSYIKIA